MKKIYALFISLFITFFIFSLIPQNEVNKMESTRVVRVIDGDTIEVENKRIFRLANINSPEKGDYSYEESMNFLLNFLNKSIDYEIISIDNNKREVARIYYSDRYLNLELVKRGFSLKAWVDEEELKLFSSSEIYAIENNLGIWKKSDFYNCLNLTIYPKVEKIQIDIICDNFLPNNWILRDESRESIIFSSKYNKVFILSGDKDKNLLNTQNDSDFIIWSEKNILNDDRDSVYIFDEKNNLLHYLSYGYD